MKKEEIISVLADLHKITGFRFSLHSTDYSEIAAFPEEKRAFCDLVHSIPEEYKKCIDCDIAACKKALLMKKTYIYKCRYGLTESVSPLYNFGTLTGFLMMGQIVESSDSKKNIYPACAKLCDFGISESKINNLLQKIPIIKPDMLNSYVRIMTICAQYLTLSNAFPNEKPTVGQSAKKYIHDNYSEKLLIKNICENIGCSKSTLITSFKKEFDCTVNEYITRIRLNEAIKMMRAGEKSIGEIAIASGFSDQSYFSKVFSSKYGVSPSEYEKNNNLFSEKEEVN